ncbi:glycosyltransferase family 4 protein [Singulisphaera sp. Ch08]|uniref:Glycosyltransferase family 4 protein n=1 Tax=Singulisphaera sp. Ch08 TaxID=3120278 RepID=A0AAU7CQM9_9BACT
MIELAGLRIAFIAGTLGQGGAERQLYYILGALRESGVAVRLLCLTRGEYWERRIRALGVPVAWAGASEWKAARLYRIIATLAEDSPDLIQSHHFYTNLYAEAAARALGALSVGAIRNDALSEVRANGRILGRLSLRTPQWIAANSSAGIQNAIELGVPSGRIRLLSNVVDTEQFSPPTVGRDSNVGQRAVRILAVGRLERQKRFDRLLGLLAQLRSRTTSRFVARIVGGGSLGSELEAQANAFGLTPGTLQFQPPTAEMASFYRTADVLVLTSDWEGTPNVVLEAMASGLPVMATKVGGVADLIQHGLTGLLAAPDDERGMLENLSALVESARLRNQLGASARDFVVANHSMEGLPRQLRSFYGSIAGRPGFGWQTP